MQLHNNSRHIHIVIINIKNYIKSISEKYMVLLRVSTESIACVIDEIICKLPKKVGVSYANQTKVEACRLSVNSYESTGLLAKMNKEIKSFDLLPVTFAAWNT
jgi:hypothetical protein